jgi:CBS domain-containing membrane protein
MTAFEIRTGACYSNGDFGAHWAVRQVLTIAGEPACVRYKVLVGEGRRREHSCKRDEFAAWARYEVVRNENSWKRIG